MYEEDALDLAGGDLLTLCRNNSEASSDDEEEVRLVFVGSIVPVSPSVR